MDAPKDAIYEGKEINLEPIYQLNLMVQNITSEFNIEFLDLTKAFANDFKRNNKKFEFQVDNHWSKYGHAIASDTIHNFLQNRK